MRNEIVSDTFPSVFIQDNLDNVREYLEMNNHRLLTDAEELTIATYLYSMVKKNQQKTWWQKSWLHRMFISFKLVRRLSDAKGQAAIAELSFIQMLSYHTARMVAEIHEDIPTPSAETSKKVLDQVTAVANFLRC